MTKLPLTVAVVQLRLIVWYEPNAKYLMNLDRFVDDKQMWSISTKQPYFVLRKLPSQTHRNETWVCLSVKMHRAFRATHIHQNNARPGVCGAIRFGHSSMASSMRATAINVYFIWARFQWRKNNTNPTRPSTKDSTNNKVENVTPICDAHLQMQRHTPHTVECLQLTRMHLNWSIDRSIDRPTDHVWQSRNGEIEIASFCTQRHSSSTVWEVQMHLRMRVARILPTINGAWCHSVYEIELKYELWNAIGTTTGTWL